MTKIMYGHMLSVVFLLECVSTTAFSASINPLYIFLDNKNNTGYYLTANQACEAAMPNSLYTSQGAAYYPQYGTGCLYRAPWIQNDIFAQNWILSLLVCPSGFVYTSGVCQSNTPDNDDSCSVGNPISIATGIKQQLEVDFSLPDSELLPLQIARYYTSYVVNDTYHYGHGWSLKSYYYHINVIQSENKIYVIRAPDKRWTFHQDTGSTYKSMDAPEATLDYITDSQGGYWRLTSNLYDEEIYSSTTGKLLEIKRGNQHHELTYSDSTTPTNIASSANLLIKITDKKERSLFLFYDSDNYLTRVDYNNQTVLTYTYGTVQWNNNRQLTSVIFSDGTQRQYHYENYTPPSGPISTAQLNSNNLYIADNVGSQFAVSSTDMNALSLSLSGYSIAPLIGITDESGEIYASWGYDEQGRAFYSEHANGTDRVNLNFNSDNSTTITNALGKQTIYHYQTINNTRKISSIEGLSSANCFGANKVFIYNTNGFIVSKTDYNGNVTTYIRDSQGREVSRTEASGTPEARIITTTWDTMLNKPLTITDSKKVTEYSYDSNGLLLSEKQRAIQ
ncbi:MAG: hypothetical protein K1563_08145 [Candidatus Thiodiazotropha sp. (ex. Lucinisca nassula)]|nr:hypothetical protein [Candidatus Thiodiazotropha sp. (ex. Lucinisca nassula)]MBW9273643.1 hypothetical protein [Candidatus Thiodiazotropha sp. (ex. Lucinisca nassula)]